MKTKRTVVALGLVFLSCTSRFSSGQDNASSPSQQQERVHFDKADTREIGGLAIEAFVNNYVMDAQAQDFPPGTSDANIGRGYDSATNEVKEQCIVYNGNADELWTVLPDKDNPDVQSVYFKMTHVTDSEDLFRSLKIDASASFSSGAYSGSASVSYATSKAMSRYHEFLLINEEVTNLTQFLKATNLTPKAQKAVKDHFAFRTMCGDEFIVGIQTGGSFSAILNATASSEEEQTRVAGTFSAAAYGNSLDVKTVSEFKDLVRNNSLDITVLRQGPNDKVPNDLDKIQAYAETLPSKVKPHGGTPWPIVMTTKKYGSLGPVISGKQGVFLDAAGTQYMRLNRLSAGLEYIAVHKDLFGGFDQKQYDTEHDAAENGARQLAAQASDCAHDTVKDNFSKCPTPSFKRPRELPQRIKWVLVDPRVDGFTEVGRTQGGEESVAEARGQYSFHYFGDARDTWYPASGGVFSIRDANGAERKVQADRIWPIGDYSAVSYRIFDSYYPDNMSRPDDRLRAAVYTPLYPLPIKP